MPLATSELPALRHESRMFPKTANPAVIRTNFENQQAWDAICKLIRAPVREGSDTFLAFVEFLEGTEYRNISTEELLQNLPPDYNYTFLFVVDGACISNPDFPILVVDLHESRGRSFRAIPSQVHSIENNLSIANMDFEEFAKSVDEDGNLSRLSKIVDVIKENRDRRLKGILTQFCFCEFRRKEFFNSHAC
jgi:hypothetical protein